MDVTRTWSPPNDESRPITPHHAVEIPTARRPAGGDAGPTPDARVAVASSTMAVAARARTRASARAGPPARRGRRDGRLKMREYALRAVGDASDAEASPSGEVFVARVPLEGFEGVSTAAAAVFGARGARGASDAHWMVLVRHAGDDHASVYDFLPTSPKSPATAAKLLAGREVRGEIRSRRMAGVPARGRRCVRVGTTRVGLGGRIGIESAISDFHARWNAEELKLGTNDCRNHAKELAKWLTCDYGQGLEFDVGENGDMTCRQTEEFATEEEDDAVPEFVPEPTMRPRSTVAAAARSERKEKKRQKSKGAKKSPKKS